MVVRVDIVSDVICPWCWVGKRNLEKAVRTAGLTMGQDVQVTWKPYMLRPSTPAEGTPKPPSTPGNPRVGTRLKQAGEGVGIDFTGKTDRTPHTGKAHVLIDVCKDDPELQDKVVESLFRRYFTDGEFVGEDSVLREAAKEAGVPDVEAAMTQVQDPARLAEIEQEALRNARLGISGVPTFFFNGRQAFSGAQPPSAFLPFLQQ